MWISLSLLTIMTVTRLASTSTFGCDSSFRLAFKKYSLVPQVIPDYPESPFIQIFGDYIVDQGNVISPVYTTNKPFSTYDAKEDELYTLIAVDPDFPQYFYSLHLMSVWGLLVNIPGSNVWNGTALTHYVPPAPLPGSGDHRYLTVVYKQPYRINVTTELLISSAASMRNFSLTQFVERFDLGCPIAGNFFRTRQTLCGCDEPKDCCDTKCDCVNVNKIKK